MSLRQSYPSARLPDSHVFITFSRGERMRTFAVRPWALYACVGLAPALCGVYLAATGYLVFRDDMLSGLMSRQAQMQYAYEDRIAALRSQIDRVTSRQLLDQDSFEGKVHDLLSRQAQLESRGAVIASLASQAGFGRDTAVAMPKSAESRPVQEGKGRAAAPVKASLNPLLKDRETPQLPAGALGFAPLEPASARAESQKPAPLKPQAVDETQELPRFAEISGRSDEPVDPTLPIPQRLSHIASSLDRLEINQIRELSSIEQRARTGAQKVRQALVDAGLPADRMAPPREAAGGVGGPFVPLKVDPNGSLFEREVSRLQTSLVAADKFRRLAPFVPLRAPLPSGEQTSGFGARVDPFLGRAAMHAGVDFRDDVGSPIRATGGGVVTTAGPNGGYGNMVEIDHGNGLTTRYAHMSAVNVSEGQHVVAGTVVGKLGSTGRSTGPHLHYEVRIDGDAVDPTRFLRAGARLFLKPAG